MIKMVDKVNNIPAADQVFDAIHVVMHLYRSGHMQMLREDLHHLTHMDTRVLSYFYHHPNTTQSDLVAHSKKDKAQLTRLVHGLRKKGYLLAAEDQQDRRSVRLHLSPEGKMLQEQLQILQTKRMEQAVHGLSEAQCNELVSLLRIIQTNLETDED